MNTSDSGETSDHAQPVDDPADQSLFGAFSELVEHATLIVDGNQRITSANPATQSVFGVSDSQSMIGTAVENWLPAFNIAQVSPDHGDSCSPKPSDAPCVLQAAVHHSGTHRRVTVQQKRLGHGSDTRLLLIVRPHGELHRLRKQLQQQLALMNLASLPCLVQAPTGEIEVVNPSFEQTFGYAGHEVIGKLPREFLTGELTNTAEMKAALETVLMGGSVKRDEALYTKSGMPVWISYEQHAITDELGEVSYVVTTGMDISDRKKSEQMKSDFVSMVGHELRTPLTAVSGALDILTDKRFVSLPEGVQDIVAMAQRNCNTLNILIGDLLDINKIEAGLVALDLQSVHLAQCVAPLLTDLQQKAAVRRIELHQIEGDPETLVAADPVRLQQILGNLVTNAIKYCSEGDDIWVRYGIENESVNIDVVDNGPGIDEQLHAHVFDKFTRAQAVAAEGIEGFGLGLSICKGLVEQMGGRITLASAPGEGAVFRIALPLAKTRQCAALSTR